MGLELDLGLLTALLVQAINGGGAGWLAFLIWNKVAEWWPVVNGWPTDATRASVWGICVAISEGSYFLLAWLGIVPLPTTPQEWVQTLFSVAMTAFFSSQMFHGGQKH